MFSNTIWDEVLKVFAFVSIVVFISMVVYIVGFTEGRGHNRCELVEKYQTPLLAEVGYNMTIPVPDNATIFLVTEKKYCWDTP